MEPYTIKEKVEVYIPKKTSEWEEAILGAFDVESNRPDPVDLEIKSIKENEL